MTEHKFPYKWNLSDGYPAKGIGYHGKKVFGIFICGGGSTMGYKLSGFEHLGGVEIDKEVADVSAQQHKYYHSSEPRHFYKSEFCAIGSYPQDYDFKELKYGYLIGMSVPPVMTAQIAHQIYLQWLK